MLVFFYQRALDVIEMRTCKRLKWIFYMYSDNCRSYHNMTCIHLIENGRVVYLSFQTNIKCVRSTIMLDDEE